MHLIGVARLGRDAEVRYLQDGTAVSNLSLAWNYGKKDGEGNRPTQWVDAALFGDRAEKLSQYLLKGTQIMVHLSDPRIEEYDKTGGGKGFKLVSRVDHIEFVGGQQQGQQGQQRQQAPQQPRQQTPQREQRQAPQQNYGGGGGFADMGEDIPFMSMAYGMAHHCI